MKTKKVPFDINKAKAGAKIVTRNGSSVRITCTDVDAKIEGFTLLVLARKDGKELPYLCRENGKASLDESKESELDLFIEEEVEETDDYNPYKATVESIADMVEIYSELQSLEELKHFYNNVRVKCREAIEYDKKWNKEQDEKPADNKPKFQKGDWVIDKQGMIQKITNVIENVTNHTYGYDTISYSLGFLSYGYFSEIKKDIRLWNIKDAKSGDVLVCIGGKYGQEVGIVKKYVGKYGGCDKCFETYCFVDWEGRFRLGEYIGSKEIYPATEEQRDLLFQKMKEAGYEWDFNKRELHKIGEKVKTRRMTNQEFTWWLRECPEEHREYCHKRGTTAHSNYYYSFDNANEEVEEDILIRKNGGEWEEPLIEL